MLRHLIASTVATAASLLAFLGMAFAEMGPCQLDDQGPAICGNGNGAARLIYKTMSPSKRYAFAWRLTDRPPTDKPAENDPNLENFVVRVDDGRILAKSHGAYWDLGNKIAKAFVYTAWSPDSHLLVKMEQRAESSSAELFAFAEDDRTIGPLELVDVIKPALLAKMQAVKDASSYHLVFFAHPPANIDNQGLMHVWVQAEDNDSQDDGNVYDITVQITRALNSLNAEIVSAAPYPGASISVIVH